MIIYSPKRYEVVPGFTGREALGQESELDFGLRASFSGFWCIIICNLVGGQDELRPDQRDTDSLPPYDVLDPLLHTYVEEDRKLRDRGDGL